MIKENEKIKKFFDLNFLCVVEFLPPPSSSETFGNESDNFSICLKKCEKKKFFFLVGNYKFNGHVKRFNRFEIELFRL